MHALIDRTITPTAMAKERWMRMPTGGLFVFSGWARFGQPGFFEVEPEDYDISLVGSGDTDTDEQSDVVQYHVTDMYVGPHWLRVQGVCPLVVAGGAWQQAPDEADFMGWQVHSVNKINLVDFGGYKRIELQLTAQVRGGTDGSIPGLAYQVLAYGSLAKDIGNEGVFYDVAI